MSEKYLDKEKIKCKDLVMYKHFKNKNKTSWRFFTGIKSDKKGYIHEFIDLNTFEKKLTKIPENSRKQPIKDIKYYCDLNKKLLKPNNQQYKDIKKKI